VSGEGPEILLERMKRASARGGPSARRDLPARGAAIGVITPSASIVVERVTIDLMRDFPGASVHFSRTPVRGAADPYPDSYDFAAMLAAARLIADVEPDVILWAGSKGAKIGVENDRLLCRRIKEETGVEATTPTLALEQLIFARAIKTVGLVTPYTPDYQAQLVRGLGAMGVSCLAEAHAGIADNLAYAEVDADEIRGMAHSVAAPRPDAILAWCTNFAAGRLAGEIEQELGAPFYDATTLGLWRALSMLGLDPSRAAPHWGSLFLDARPLVER
jgi:maleate isomerase